MTSEIAKILANSLEPLYNKGLVTVLGSLVKTASVQRDGRVIRFPVPYSDEDQPIQIDNSEFMPDASQRCIVYFEGENTNVTDANSERARMSTPLRLVCWYDSNKFQYPEGTNDSLASALTKLLLQGLMRVKGNTGLPVYITDITPTRILDSSAALFSRYTYREERNQYLTAPYYALGIDLTINYQINYKNGCTPELTPTDWNANGC